MRGWADTLADMLYIEGLKARRSRLPWITALGFLLAPAAIGLLMYVAMHPEAARQMGILRAKADLSIGIVNWATYLATLTQAIAVGGLLLFSLALSWIIGREYVDGTLKDLLAAPTPRSMVLVAKFIIWSVWCLGLTMVVFLGGLTVGSALRLPQGGGMVLLLGWGRMAGVAMLTMLTLTPIAWFASAGGGYLAPVGAAFAFLALSQVAAVLGWGAYFPWSIPALYSGLVSGVTLQPASYGIVLITAAVGVLAVNRWWNYADHAR